MGTGKGEEKETVSGTVNGERMVTPRRRIANITPGTTHFGSFAAEVEFPQKKVLTHDASLSTSMDAIGLYDQPGEGAAPGSTAHRDGNVTGSKIKNRGPEISQHNSDSERDLYNEGNNHRDTGNRRKLTKGSTMATALDLGSNSSISEIIEEGPIP